MRSSLLHELVRVVGTLQQLQPDLPPAYLIENVAFQTQKDSKIAVTDYQTVCDMIGYPVVLDAAQFGSLAHRVRNWWTNMCTQAELMAAVSHVQRPSGRTVSLALAPGRQAQPVRSADRLPRYLCNLPGHPMQAWPTLVAHHSRMPSNLVSQAAPVPARVSMTNQRRMRESTPWASHTRARQHQALQSSSAGAHWVSPWMRTRLNAY